MRTVITKVIRSNLKVTSQEYVEKRTVIAAYRDYFEQT